MTDENTPKTFDPESYDPDQTLKSAPVPQDPEYGETVASGNVVPSPAKVTAPAYFPRSTTPPPPPSLTSESAARERARRRRARGNSSDGEWAWVIIAVALLSVIGMLGLIIFVIVRSSASDTDILPTASINHSALPTAISLRSDPNAVKIGNTITLDDGSSLRLQSWDGQSRLTVLAMGLDRRPGHTGLNYRTDTMILISIDPVTNQVGILSIPRDMYVVVPGYRERQRVNAAMVFGGPELAMQTVQYNLGLHVHEFVVVDFQAVIEFIDAIGGITIVNETTIHDWRYPDMFYGYDPFHLEAGTHHLYGEMALKFARTRHSSNDIDRAGRQQHVLFAIRDRILQLDMLPQLILKAPILLESLQENVETSLNLEQMIQLALYLKDITDENIKTGVIGFQYMISHTTNSGAQVLIPNNARLSQLMVDVLGESYAQ